jgi:hypothetical protein
MNYVEKNLSHCHFVHHKSQMDWPWNKHRLMVTGWQLTTSAMVQPCFASNVIYFFFYYLFHFIRDDGRITSLT